MTTTTKSKFRSENGRLGETKIPRALLEADVATLRLALEHRQKEEIQQVLEEIRELDAKRTELNARLMGLGYRQNGVPAPRTLAGAGRRGRRSDLADGLAETLFLEALKEHPGERPGFYYDRILSANGNMGQARRILAALVEGGKVKAEGNRPHTRYSLA